MAEHETGTDLSEAARKRLGELRFFGEFNETEATARALALITTDHGAAKSDDHIKLGFLVDEEGIVRDVRYRSLATGHALFTFEMLAEYCLNKPIAELSAVTPQTLTQYLYKEAYGCEASTVGAGAADQAYFVLVKISGRYHGTDTEDASAPAADDAPKTSQQLAWDECGLFEKVRRIETVLDEHVRPALASDGGGMDLIDLREPELVVQYSGACGSCSSSVGGTMNFIEDTLEANLGIRFKLVVEGVDEESMFSF